MMMAKMIKVAMMIWLFGWIDIDADGEHVVDDDDFIDDDISDMKNVVIIDDINTIMAEKWRLNHP